ncbi:MAG TPA: serine protease [Pilimelia sp.]|nr:serine protease [Pilimelia sp.]
MRATVRSAVLAFTVGATAAVPGAAWAQAADPGDTRIVGGKVTTERWPFTGSIQSGGRHSCGSALISPTWIVTAKHCVSGNGATIRLATNDNASGGEMVQVTRWVRGGLDIALGQLRSPAKTTPIPIAAEHGPIGTQTRLLGWGATTASGGSPARYLKELDTSIVDPSRCSYSGGNPDREREICTDNPGGNQGACFGDSGGPQIKQVNGRWELIGVTSRGERICARNPSVYVSVSAHLDWVKQNVKDLPQS